MGREGKFHAKSSGWDENRDFLEDGKLGVAVKNGGWAMAHLPARSGRTSGRALSREASDLGSRVDVRQPFPARADYQLVADRRDFLKVKLWTRDGVRVDRLPFASNSFAKARALFMATTRDGRRSEVPRFVRHQYSSASMIVITRSVSEGSDGSGE
jgi:hypothetical protein